MLLRSMHVSTRMGMECFVTSLAMSPADDTGRPEAVDAGVGRGSPKPAPGPKGEAACSPNVINRHHEAATQEGARIP